MGRSKKRNSLPDGPGNPIHMAKKAKPETGESYMVKKYRAEKHYNAMDAFVKYTKSHRMLDATYIRLNAGVTSEKPFVFSTRVGGVDLGWGRGKSREAAMDCACRAAFALVGAHGYKNFTLDDDCLLEPPMDLPPPPPPPPPLAPPLPGMPPGMPPGFPPGFAHPGLPPFPPPGGFLPPPPPPIGLPPPPLPPGGLHLPPPPPPMISADLIPQPKIAPNLAPVASSLSNHNHNHIHNAVSTSSTAAQSSDSQFQSHRQPSAPAVSLNLNRESAKATSRPTRSQLKGGLTLVFDPGTDGPEEESMEEMRGSLQRYQKMLRLASKAQSAS